MSQASPVQRAAHRVLVAVAAALLGVTLAAKATAQTHVGDPAAASPDAHGTVANQVVANRSSPPDQPASVEEAAAPSAEPSTGAEPASGPAAAAPAGEPSTSSPESSATNEPVSEPGADPPSSEPAAQASAGEPVVAPAAGEPAATPLAPIAAQPTGGRAEAPPASEAATAAGQPSTVEDPSNAEDRPSDLPAPELRSEPTPDAAPSTPTTRPRERAASLADAIVVLPAIGTEVSASCAADAPGRLAVRSLAAGTSLSVNARPRRTDRALRGRDAQKVRPAAAYVPVRLPYQPPGPSSATAAASATPTGSSGNDIPALAPVLAVRLPAIGWALTLLRAPLRAPAVADRLARPG